jgi:hypothetical protein
VNLNERAVLTGAAQLYHIQGPMAFRERVAYGIPTLRSAAGASEIVVQVFFTATFTDVKPYSFY